MEEFSPTTFKWEKLVLKREDFNDAISHHSSVVYQNKMYLFGGSFLAKENHYLFRMDMNHLKWERMEPVG